MQDIESISTKYPDSYPRLLKIAVDLLTARWQEVVLICLVALYYYPNGLSEHLLTDLNLNRKKTE